MNNRIIVIFLIWISLFLRANALHAQESQYDGLPVVYVTELHRYEFDFYAIDPIAHKSPSTQ